MLAYVLIERGAGLVGGCSKSGWNLRHHTLSLSGRPTVCCLLGSSMSKFWLSLIRAQGRILPNLLRRVSEQAQLADQRLGGRLDLSDRLLEGLPGLLGHPMPAAQPPHDRHSGLRVRLDQYAAAPLEGNFTSRPICPP